MKIIIASWAPFVGGAEVAAERLALGLQDAGHDVVMVIGTNGEALCRMRDAGLHCELVPMALTDKWRWWRYTAARRELIRIFRRQRPDLIHCNDLPTSQMVGEAAARLGIPRVCHHRFPFETGAAQWLNKFGAERHLFVSRALMHEMCGDSDCFARKECAVVYDGLALSPRPINADQQAARRALELPPDKVLVLFAGQLIERKGVADLIQAWNLISPSVAKHSELLIIGDDLQHQGKYRRAMEQLARRIDSPARFFGFQCNVSQWIVAADLAVVPSHVEPLGNATLEAMSFCRPVIGCCVGGIPEMVVHDETGLLVPLREPTRLAAAIERLAADRDVRLRMGEAGRSRCEDLFSLDTHVENVLAEYEIVLNRRQSAIVVNN
jgi:glycosyltransferase involved in cell wall biosynthesis